MLKIGDRVKISDWSYAFGIRNGKFDTHNYGQGRTILTVIQIDLRVAENGNQLMSNGQPAIADILVTDSEGGFWFVTSYLTSCISHTVIFDGGKAIEISDESYQALKNQLS